MAFVNYESLTRNSSRTGAVLLIYMYDADFNKGHVLHGELAVRLQEAA